jgi:hypothetical protein
MRCIAIFIRYSLPSFSQFCKFIFIAKKPHRHDFFCFDPASARVRGTLCISSPVHPLAFVAFQIGSSCISPPCFALALTSVGKPLIVSQDLSSARRSS